MPLYVEIHHVNLDRGVRYADEPPTEAFTDNVGELYRRCQKEFGRCVSKVYRDVRLRNPDGKGGETWTVKAIGWVYHKRVPYEDTEELYLRETWVKLHESPPTLTPHYKEIT